MAERLKAGGLRPPLVGVNIVGSNPTRCTTFIYVEYVAIAMEIEYLEAFEELQEKDTFRGQQWFGERSNLVKEYSWAVPTEDVIRYCAQFDDLLEIGAGNGYWASLIEEMSGDVQPTDQSPPEDTYTEVKQQIWQNLIPEIQERPVLMVWPPYNEGVAAGVARHSPNHILYVGESRGGCTGEDEFFDIVEEQYGLVGKLDIPSYTGIHDNFFHYARNI